MIKVTHKKQLKNAVKNLNRIIKSIREYIPDANIFLESGNLIVHSKAIHKVGYDEWQKSQIYNAGVVKYFDSGGY